MKIFTRVLSYAFRYKTLLISAVFFALLLVAAKVAGIFGFSNFFVSAFIGSDFSAVNLKTVLILLGLGSLYAGTTYMVLMLSNSLAVSVMHDIRRDLYEKLVDLPISYYKKNRTGEILSRLLNDISVIEIFFMNILIELLVQPLTLVAVICALIWLNPKLSLYFFSIVPFLGIVLAILGSLVQKLSSALQGNISSITSNIQETVYGIEVIKGYAVEKPVKDKFSVSNDNYLKASLREIRVRVLGTPASTFFGVVAIIIIIVLGAVSVQAGVATAGDITKFMLFSLVLSEPLSKTNELLMVPRKMIGAAKRVFEIIDNKESEADGKPSIGELKGKLEWKDVSFEYAPGLGTLSDVNLSVKPGETLAIVGPSGAGKSSLIALIPAFYYPASGTLSMDGKDIKDFDPVSIRKQISLVTQETILFSGTILENIRLSKPEATVKEIIEAAEVANAHGFISRLDEGYETMLGDRGVRLSGGEKQRIALARAVLRKPKILILDEATSSLDAESESQIQKAMQNILGRQTTIIVTHKLSTISSADQIIVMESGKIAERGTHKELVDNKGIYEKLFAIQVRV